jgi:hypothetical protein
MTDGGEAFLTDKIGKDLGPRFLSATPAAGVNSELEPVRLAASFAKLRAAMFMHIGIVGEL